MNENAPTSRLDPDSVSKRVAILLIGDEIYGIGTILKLYATGLPDMSFVAMGEGAMVDWLRANGNRVDVVPGLTTFKGGGPSLLTVAKVPAALMQARSDAARIHRLLEPRGIRIVQTQSLPQQFITGFLRKRGYRTVWQINNNMNPRRLMGIGVTLNHRFARWGADLLLPASDAIARHWHGCGVPSMTIRNAAIPMFSQPNELPEQPVRCLVAGRLEHDKGHHLAVEAIENARQAGLEVCLDIYGGPLEDNPYADRLRAQIAESGCPNAFCLMGF